MMALTSMSSFSDAHESTNIPIIGRQLHYLLPPRQSQIWAVLYDTDSVERFMYSLTATFYGRMCLSGPVHDLSDEQMATVHDAVKLYRVVAPIIRNGYTHFLGELPLNWRDPAGWAGICRISPDGSEALVVIHEYARETEGDITVELPLTGTWKVLDCLHDGTTDAPSLSGTTLTLAAGADFRGYTLHLSR